MSKQSNLVREVASKLFPDIKEEVELQKITKVLLHKGIRVDFYVPSKNLVIEVHGIQHFKESGFGANKVTAMSKLNNQRNRDDKLIKICDAFGLRYLQLDYDVHNTQDVILRTLLEYI